MHLVYTLLASGFIGLVTGLLWITLMLGWGGAVQTLRGLKFSRGKAEEEDVR